MRWKAFGTVFGLVALQAKAQNATETEGAVSVQGGYDYGKTPPLRTITEYITSTSTRAVCNNQPSSPHCPSPSPITVTYYEPPKHGSPTQHCPSNAASTVTIVTTSFIKGGGHPGEGPSNCLNCPKECTPTKTHTAWSTKTHHDVQHSIKTHTIWKTHTEYQTKPASVTTATVRT